MKITIIYEFKNIYIHYLVEYKNKTDKHVELINHLHNRVIRYNSFLKYGYQIRDIKHKDYHY